MLSLTRRIGETLHIGDSVSLVVVAIHGDQVRIGIKAPHGLPVYREEIYRRIQLERKAGRQEGKVSDD